MGRNQMERKQLGCSRTSDLFKLDYIPTPNLRYKNPRQQVSNFFCIAFQGQLARLGDFVYFSSLFYGQLNAQKIFSSENYETGTLSQPKTSSADVIVISHHRNNADIKFFSQFRKTLFFKFFRPRHSTVQCCISRRQMDDFDVFFLNKII